MTFDFLDANSLQEQGNANFRRRKIQITFVHTTTYMLSFDKHLDDYIYIILDQVQTACKVFSSLIDNLTTFEALELGCVLFIIKIQV